MGYINLFLYILDIDDNGSIALAEWAAGIKPRRPCAGADPAHYLSVEQRNLFQRAWLEQLAALFGLLIQADAELDEKIN